MKEVQRVPSTSGQTGPEVSDSDEPRVVVVVGPGRSGTSTVAGALAKSGFQVPGRAISGNATNPSGFFEPRWVVDFHKELLDRARVATMDTAPDALERTAEVADASAVRDTLRDWLAERLREQRHLVVKDPRTVWFTDLWVGIARELGVQPGFVTMLRHPAEVSASREKYYGRGERGRARADDVRRIAGWTNVALMAERTTQGSPRSFVRYTDLVADWRPVLGTLCRDLDLTLRPGVDTSPHPVDDFIDPGLHRVRVDWADIDVPAGLRDVAEDTWQALTGLAVSVDPAAGAAGAAPAAVRRVEEVRAEYQQLWDDATALQGHAIRRLEAQARKQGRRQLRKELRAQEPGSPDDRADDRSGGGLRAPIRSLRRRLTGRVR